MSIQLDSNPDLLQLITSARKRLYLQIRGAVQGVGFRPFIYRLATEMHLTGWVNNSAQGVFIEIEGTPQDLEIFIKRIHQEKPIVASIQALESTELELADYTEFSIRPSVKGEKTAVVLPDLAICPDCLQEIFDPQNRRYNYPFTNCTNCGPRYSIIRSLPYDRVNTTMQDFQMCPQCEAEYQNPLNRRFHAQPNACPNCGPHVEFWNHQGQVLASHHLALIQASQAILEGKIVAVKGLGGFHLMVDARNGKAIQLLRQRKHRLEKPFAVMFPSLEAIKQSCQVSLLEEKLLRSPAAPIVLLKSWKNKENNPEIHQSVAPGNPNLGVMLPYTPLHCLLMAKSGFPVVATSGNLSDEPICIDEFEALQRLGQIADVFLVHNRPIVRAIDDSVVRVVSNQEMILRSARGYAPFPMAMENSQAKEESKPQILAVGGHLKNTVAISKGKIAFLSQHLGDLETIPAYHAFENAITSLSSLYDFSPDIVACDLHPDYRSTQFAQNLGIPIISVQHHYAHILACMAEHQLKPPVLGVAWDGTGYGDDGTIWGGEFLRIKPDFSYQRVAYLRPFQLPGGEKAVKEPRRVALGLLYQVFREIPSSFTMGFSTSELKLIEQMLKQTLNTPITSSMGRLFDGVAAILGIRQILNFEGQAAMELEWKIDPQITFEQRYHWRIDQSQFPLQLDWEPVILEILEDLKHQVPVGMISAKFHHSLVDAIATITQLLNIPQIVLTGGCFQNRFLLEHTFNDLTQKHYHPYFPQRIPPNDGGIALGQILAASAQF